MIKYSHKDVRILENQTAYQGFYQVINYQVQYRLFKGTWSEPVLREVFKTQQVAGVLLYDSGRQQVVLVEQFRIGTIHGQKSPWLVEVVAGVMDKQDTDFEALAYRETKEETGLEPLAMLPICEYWSSPGGSTEFVKLFCASVDASQAGGVHGLTDENEDIRVVVMDVQEAFAAVASGKICNAITIIALQWLQLKQAELAKIWG